MHGKTVPQPLRVTIRLAPPLSCDVFCSGLSATDVTTTTTFAAGWGCGKFVFKTMKYPAFTILFMASAWLALVLFPLELTGHIPVYSGVGVLLLYSGFMAFTFSLCNPTLVKNLASMVDAWRLLGSVVLGLSLLAALMGDGRALAVILFSPGCVMTPLTDAMPAFLRYQLSIVGYFGASLFCSVMAVCLLFGAIPVHDFDLVNAGNLRITALSTCINMFLNAASFYLRFGVKAVQHPEDFVIYISAVECIRMTEQAYHERLLVEEALAQTAIIAVSKRQASKRAGRTAKVKPASAPAPLPAACIEPTGGSAEAHPQESSASMVVAVISTSPNDTG
jgi:hypothetical protein